VEAASREPIRIDDPARTVGDLIYEVLIKRGASPLRALTGLQGYSSRITPEDYGGARKSSPGPMRGAAVLRHH
jgi:hypothetical protein